MPTRIQCATRMKRFVSRYGFIYQIRYYPPGTVDVRGDTVECLQARKSRTDRRERVGKSEQMCRRSVFGARILHRGVRDDHRFATRSQTEKVCSERSLGPERRSDKPAWQAGRRVVHAATLSSRRYVDESHGWQVSWLTEHACTSGRSIANHPDRVASTHRAGRHVSNAGLPVHCTVTCLFIDSRRSARLTVAGTAPELTVSPTGLVTGRMFVARAFPFHLARRIMPTLREPAVLVKEQDQRTSRRNQNQLLHSLLSLSAFPHDGSTVEGTASRRGHVGSASSDLGTRSVR